jgi:hypothetical protein
MEIYRNLIVNFKINADVKIDLSQNAATAPSPSPSPSAFHISQIQKFNLPIEYLNSSDIFALSPIVSSDLELVVTKSQRSMYEYLFQPTHTFGKLLVPSWGKAYTTNTIFLNDTRHIVENFDKYNECVKKENPVDCGRMFEIWDDVKQDTSFHERYGFIEWEMLKQFNRSPPFLQLLSFMNVLSPAVSLLLPFVFILFPFLLLKIQGVPISFETYKEVLMNIAKHHFIGKTLVNLQSFSWDKIVYLIITMGLYGLQIYQNAMSCVRYYRNITKITNIVLDTRKFAEHSIRSMENFLLISDKCSSYNEFCENVRVQCDRLKEIQTRLSGVTPYRHTMSSFMNNGDLLTHFYQLYENPEYEECLRFAMGFEGYMDNIGGVHKNIKSGVVHFANFDKENECKINKQYYPPLMNEDAVNNDCSLKENIIITAPNKAGKTTILKTTAVNIIFSQQVGCGFYTSATINPYTHIHSYLNIPDTSERDSLFQAESRRCKEIIDIINENPDKTQTRHFCIFDELYSGTNPEEATQAGKAFLTYLCKYPNLRFLLTTHYVKICKHFKKSNVVRNYMMAVDVLPDGNFEYKYIMKPGISKLKGGIRVLKDMDYPVEILADLE